MRMYLPIRRRVTSLFEPVACSRLQLHRVRFESEGLAQEIRSRQRVGPNFQHHTSSDIDGGVKVSVHELHAFIAAGGTHR